MKNRMIAWLLCLTMLVSVMPMPTALAEEATEASEETTMVWYCIEEDRDPYTGSMTTAAEGQLYTLDTTYNSVGVDLGAVKTVNRVVLTDSDALNRLHKAELSLYVSADNVSYSKVKSFDTAFVGEKVYFYNFSAEARYVKVHCHMESTTDTSFSNTPEDMLWVGNESELPGNGGGSFTKLGSIHLRAAMTDYDTVAFVKNSDIEEFLPSCNEDRSDLRFALDGQMVPYYLTTDGVYLRMPQTTANTLYELNVYGGNDNAVSLSDMEYVFEVTYGNRTYMDVTSGWFENNIAATTAPNGDIIAIANSKAKYPVLYQRRSTDGGRTWSEEELIFDGADINAGADMSGSFIVDGNRMFYFFFLPSNEMYDSTYHYCETTMMVSDNNGYTWSEPVGIGHPDIFAEWCFCDGIMPLSYDGADGSGVDYVLPMHGIANINGANILNVSALYSTDCGATWQHSESLLDCGLAFDDSENGASEPAVFMLSDGTLKMLMRAQNSSEPVFYESVSTDNGISWSDAVPSNVYTSNTMAAAKNNGDDIILTWAGNNVMGTASYFRYPLTLACSDDDSATWQKKLNVWQGTSVADAAGFYMKATQPSLLFSSYGDTQDAMITWHHYNLSNSALLIEDWEEYLYKSKGAANSFESSSAFYDDWQPTYKTNPSASGSPGASGSVPVGTVEISTDMASAGSHSLKILDARATRSIPSMMSGEISFDLNMNSISDSNVVVEFKSAYSNSYYTADRMYMVIYPNGGLNFYDTNNWVSLKSISNSGWVNLSFRFDMATNEIAVYADGVLKGTVTASTMKNDAACTSNWDGISFVQVFNDSATTPIYIDNFIAYEGASFTITEADNLTYITELSYTDTTNGGSVTPYEFQKWTSYTIDNETRTINIVMPSYNNPRVASITHSGGTTSLIGTATSAAQHKWSGLVEQYTEAYLYDGQIITIPSETGKSTRDYTVHITFPEVSLEGSGTKEDPFLIQSDADINYMYTKMTTNNWTKGDSWTFAGAYIKQTADVTCSVDVGHGTAWVSAFEAHYDGDGYTITYVDPAATRSATVAVFGNYFRGSVKNITLDGTIQSEGSDVVLAGTLCAGSVLQNVHSKLTMNGATNAFVLANYDNSEAIVENFLFSGTLSATTRRSVFYGNTSKTVYTCTDTLTDHWANYTDVSDIASTGELLTTLNAYAEKNGLVKWGQVIGTDATPILGKVVLTLTPSIEDGSRVANETLLTLTTQEGATIYYTLDGSVPNENSALYVDGISLGNAEQEAIDITVKALVKLERAEDAVFTFNYTVKPATIENDLNGDRVVNSRDAVYLLYHTMLPEQYPVSGDCDYNGDGSVNSKDATYLLYHIMLPSVYPIA